MSPHRCILVVTPWKRRWELGDGAGLADDHHFIAGLTARGYAVHYIGPRDRDPPDVSTPGYYRHHFPNFYEPTAGWPTPLKRLIWPLCLTLLAGWRAWRVGRAARPSMVLAQTHMASAAAFLAARALGVPSAAKLFGVMDLAEARISRWQRFRRDGEMLAALHFHHDAWIVLDDGTRGDEALRRAGIPPERIHFLANGVDLEWADRSGDAAWLHEKARIDEAAPVVLYIARLVDWKRPDLFVRAAALVLERHRASFVLAGDGPERERCETLARSLGVGEHVHFPGPIPHARVPDALAASRVFVATSRHSNRSIAVCEALVCGVPVVAFDTGGTRAVVRDGETGRLVPDGDVLALASALAELLRDEEKRRAMGEKARTFAKTHFTDWRERVEDEIRILEHLGRADGL
jgi:glycosyltransferase involved in cell wall biosynthesis